MNTRKPFKSWRLTAALTLAALQGCSTVSEQQLHSTPKLQATSLPAEISQIDTKNSESWLQEARELLAQLLAWSSSETLK